MDKNTDLAATMNRRASDPGNTPEKAYQTTDGYYLPDLNKPKALLGLLLSIELFVGCLALIKYPLGTPAFLGFLGGLSFLMLWIGLVFALLMHFMRRWLMNLSVMLSSIIQLACLLLIALSFTYVTQALVLKYLAHTDFAQGLGVNPERFYVNNVWLCLIVGGLLLRYFYIAHQNQEKIQAISAAQVQALQSRIRPHFLFNSLNSIASLVRIDPALAEQAVEDLADIFRVSLSNSTRRVSLRKELEVARLYQRIEQLRLGERLQIQWNVDDDLPMTQKVPVLIIQPLLENAIYHGIEPRTSGGLVVIHAGVSGSGNSKSVEISVRNPLPSAHSDHLVGAGRRHGNQIAMKNIEQRLRLVYGDKAWVKVTKSSDEYHVSLKFPYEDENEDENEG